MVQRLPFALYAFLLAAALLAAPAQAGPDLGVRGGLSVNPDQIVLGGHHTLHFESLAFLTWILPVAEIGFGDDVTTILLATDAVIKLPRISGWQAYGGAELGWLNVNHDAGNSSDLGFSLMVGVDKPLNDANKTAGVQLKFGISDTMPDFKALVVYSFGGD